MIRAALMVGFWAIAMPLAALVGFPIAWVQGHPGVLYRFVMWGCRAGTWISGAQVTAEGREHLVAGQSYIFMSNHVSNLDPPIEIALIPGRTSVLVKKELFKIPVLAQTMRIGDLIPVDRGNREAGVQSVRDAARVMRKGLSMMVYPEGGRSWDGKLLPMKKGPFYLAIECGIPVVPMTIVGSREVMSKGKFECHPGPVRVVFHPPIPPDEFGSKDELMARVRDVIASAMPEEERG